VKIPKELFFLGLTDASRALRITFTTPASNVLIIVSFA